MGRTELLLGDAHLVWIRWFVEAVADPRTIPPRYAEYLQRARDVIGAVLPMMPKVEQRDIAREVARYAWVRANNARLGREQLSRDDRELLLLEAGLQPRCMICGARFEAAAIEAFRVRRAQPAASLPRYVDYLMPRGLRARDLRIEIDHAIPFTHGGGNHLSNLRLVCGWCNATKGSRETLYDAGTRPLTIEHPRYGLTTVPLPYWVVRLLLITGGRCELGACRASAETTAMKVRTRFRGAPTPPNLQVVCDRHDSNIAERLVPRRAFQQA